MRKKNPCHIYVWHETLTIRIIQKAKSTNLPACGKACAQAIGSRCQETEDSGDGDFQPSLHI